MSKQTARQSKQERLKKILVSAIALLLVAVLLAGFIVMAVQAVSDTTSNVTVTVTDGTSPIPGASVTVEQVSDSTEESAPVETTPTLLKSYVLNSSDHWEAGFFKTAKTSVGNCLGQAITPSSNPNKIYRTGLIPVEGADYIYIDTPTHPTPGYAYKWKIHWYGTSAEANGTTEATVDFVGFASEQTDLSFDNQFAVPEGACYVRIAIASIKGTTLDASAETTFDADAFYNEGGLTMHLYRNEGNVLDVAINSTGILEAGTISNTTGLNEAKDGYYRTSNSFSTEGASMLAVNFPVHPDAASGSYYKWKVIFYNNNTFVSLASEITAPDTKIYFDVPSGANEYKLVFTSWENGAATAIDLDEFCQNGGLQVTLYGATASASSNWVTLNGTTDENGQASFDIPVGASVYYLVSADGYKTSTATLTAAEYANGITVTLSPKGSVIYSNALDITVNNGATAIPGATVNVEQILDPDLFTQDNVVVTKVGTIVKKGASCQGGGVYGKYFVQVEKGISGSPYTVWFHIYDMETNTYESVSLAGDYYNGQYSQYKDNNANFGTEFYQEGDPFPLLYVSSAYDYRTVAVRIYKDGDEWKTQQVQVIDYSSEMHNNDGFYSCNVLLDNENGYMYLTPIDGVYNKSSVSKQWFYKFNMPKLSDGAVVTITPDMALEERIEVAYEFAPQGACIKDGIVYQSFGYDDSTHPGKICVFDLSTGQYKAKINIYDMGFSVEPESCGFYNGSLYFVSADGGVYKMTPNDYLPTEDSSTADDVLIGTTVLNQDADWEVGFLKSASSSLGTYNGQEISPTSNPNKIYRTGLIDIGDADYIYIPTPTHATAGYAYKWKVHWYGANAVEGATTEAAIDFVGYASEQTDFDFTNRFAVPTGAKYVRICIASITGTNLSTASAQTTFPISSFLSTGGLTVQMYDEGEIVQKTTLWLAGSFTASDKGNVYLEVAPGASFLVTVSAEGYESVTQTVAPTQYANGITVTLRAVTVLGDASGDGQITADDADLIKQYRIGLVDTSAITLSACDVSGDGKVDVYDAYLIQLFLAEQISKFPAEV